MTNWRKHCVRLCIKNNHCIWALYETEGPTPPRWGMASCLVNNKVDYSFSCKVHVYVRKSTWKRGLKDEKIPKAIAKEADQPEQLLTCNGSSSLYHSSLHVMYCSMHTYGRVISALNTLVQTQRSHVAMACWAPAELCWDLGIWCLAQILSSHQQELVTL